MKKILISFILVSTCLLIGCGDYTYMKVRRTASARIPLHFVIDSKGDFTLKETINTNTIINAFDKGNPYTYKDGEIEKVNIETLAIGAVLGSANTASFIKLNAFLETEQQVSNSTIVIKETLLNDTKTIQLTNNVAVDLLSGLGNVLGVNKNNITLSNALSVLNADGAKKLQSAIEEGLKKDKTIKPINIFLRGISPSSQRLVMTVDIEIRATITFSKCELTLLYVSASPECTDYKP